MLRQTLRYSRPLFSAGKFQNNNLFNRNVIAGANAFAQRQIIPTQYRSETTDLNMSLQFPVQPEKLQQLVKRIDQLGGTLESKSFINEVYYDSVADTETVEVESELGKGRADVTTSKDQGKQERSKPAPRVKTQKKDNAALYVLTKRDMWLLRQNEKWVLRVPAVDETGRTHLELDPSRRIPIYREAEGERAIRRELSLQQDETMEARTGTPLPSLEADLASRMGVVPYAAFKTTQYFLTVPTTKGFEVGKDFDKPLPRTVENSESEVTDSESDKPATQGGSAPTAAGSSSDEASLNIEDEEVAHMLTLEIEETDFGYAIGKLSVLIENPDEEGIEEKLDTVANVLKVLDVNLVDRSNSTILEYLERHRPNHFKQLVTASVAKSHADKPKKETEAKEE